MEMGQSNLKPKKLMVARNLLAFFGILLNVSHI